VRNLEESLGAPLFERGGRKLELNEMGQLVFRYADEIFSLGHELVDAVRGQTTEHSTRLNVGVLDVIPKLVARQLLEPALALPEPVRLVCYEDSFDRLLAELALHSLHVVIADQPVPSGSSVRAFSHLLGESGVTLFGAPSLARTFRKGFPASLDGAPLLLPLESLPLRRSLNRWFARHKVKPHIVAEFEDSALFKVFGADEMGIFPAPTVVEKEVTAQYGVQVVGRPEGVRERFYAITAQRRLAHPAVQAIADTAKQELF
jgi:LysR family transcriptional activator of nhaA